jgi:hypothetical protein
MTDEKTKQLVISRFAEEGGMDRPLQQMVAQAFAIRNLPSQRRQQTRQLMTPQQVNNLSQQRKQQLMKNTTYKKRVSEYDLDQHIVPVLCRLFPNVDGYVFISKWSQNIHETFHNEVFLCRPDQCVELLRPSLQEKLLNKCLEYFLMTKNQKTRKLAQQSDILLRMYFKYNATIDVSRHVLEYLKTLIDTSTSFNIILGILLCGMFNKPLTIRMDNQKPLSVSQGWQYNALTPMLRFISRESEPNEMLLLMKHQILKNLPVVVSAVNNLDIKNEFNWNFATFITNLFQILPDGTFGTEILFSWNNVSYSQSDNTLSCKFQLFYIPSMTTQNWSDYIVFIYGLQINPNYFKLVWDDFFTSMKKIIDSQSNYCSVPRQAVLNQQNQINKKIEDIFKLKNLIRMSKVIQVICRRTNKTPQKMFQ